MDISNFFDHKRILITGATGFLAANLLGQLRNTNCHISCLIRSNSPFDFIPGISQIVPIAGDVRDLSIWEKLLERIDYVFHFAAQTSVYWANENPLEDLKINVLPMINLLETCRQKGWTPTVLFSGTVTETGLPKYFPVNETHQDNPITVYDLHKLLAENYLKYYARQGFVHGVVLRLTNVYGPGPSSSSADRGVLNLMIRKALKNEPLTIFGDGNNLRDYIYVQDAARAFLDACTQIELINGQHFIIGNGQSYTIAESFNLVSKRVELKTGLSVPVIHVEPPKPQSLIETRNFIADSSKFILATGWQATCPLSLGIDRTIDYFL